MEKIFTSFLDVLKTFITNMGEFWNWLITPWFTWGTGEEAVEIGPLMIFSFTGLMVVAAVMLIKFLNPVN